MGPFAPAQAESPGEYAKVLIDGAMVYEKPDFDSKVVSYLRRGSKVLVSKKLSGAFRRVVVKKGLAGYISEVDVQTLSESSKKGSDDDEADAKNDKKSDSKKDSRKKKPKHRQKPVAETRYVGLLVGLVNYREDVANVEPASNELSYGVKITGPNLIIHGPYLLDFNLALHVGAPQYYSPGADVPPSGYFVIMDLALLMPIMDGNDSMLYLGLGPHLNYSSFNVIYNKASYDLEELRIGAVGLIGGGYRMGNAIAKLEYKYYWDTVKYAAIQMAVQLEF